MDFRMAARRVHPVRPPITGATARAPLRRLIAAVPELARQREARTVVAHRTRAQVAAASAVAVEVHRTLGAAVAEAAAVVVVEHTTES